MLDFMTPEIWSGLVIGVTLVGIALAVLRLLNDWTTYQRRNQHRRASLQKSSEPIEPDGQPRA